MKGKKWFKRLRGKFLFSHRDTAVSIGVIAAAAALCMMLHRISSGDVYVPLIFVLAVLIVSRLTDGYFYGLAASILSVIGVNYAFTYPYFEFNFTISGYPLTFLCMLAVSLITCTLTAKVREQERLRLETEKEKMRANLLRAVSHDLRTPLTSIAGATEAILDNEAVLTDEQKHALLLETAENARWLIRMVENLLSITRIGGEAANISKTPELAEEVIGESIRKFRQQNPEVEVQVSVPEELMLVPMDAMLIEQVLLNLMENAALHGKTTRNIWLSVTPTREGAAFSLEDDGVGIERDRLPTLFSGSFYGAEREGEADKKRSMGIGLSVCMAIVRAHGGSMKAENRRSGGAKFTFILPMQ